jgi:hypothetical protein
MPLKTISTIAALTLFTGLCVFFVLQRQGVFLTIRPVSTTQSIPPKNQQTGDRPLFDTFPEDTLLEQESTPGVDSHAFTYIPKNQSSATWPESTSRLLIPHRLKRLPDPQAHLYIYLPTDNPSNASPEQSYLPTLSEVLEKIAPYSNVIIMTPHHYQGGDDYKDFDLGTFYKAGIEALQTILPNTTIVDTIVGGHESSTCKGGPVIVQALNGSVPNVRGVVAYDGCLSGKYETYGQALSPQNITPPNGTFLYLGANTSGMGSETIQTESGGELLRPAAVQQLWKLAPKNCTACAQAVGIQQCYEPLTRSEQSGSSPLMLVTYKASHKNAIRLMTSFTLCEFYAS